MTLPVDGGLREEVRAPLAIDPAWLPSGLQGHAFDQSLMASGGSGHGYRWHLAGGALPQWLQLSGAETANLRLHGTPPTPGRVELRIVLEDSSGDVAERDLALPIASDLRLAAELPPHSVVGRAYEARLSVTGGTGFDYEWAILSGEMPDGFEVKIAGDATHVTVAGVPAEAGRFPFAIEVTDAHQGRARYEFVLDVAPQIALSTSPIAAAQAGTPYTAQITATGSVPTEYRWDVDRTALPSWIRFRGADGSSSATISGTPPEPGAFWIPVTVRDGAGGEARRTVFLKIGENPPTITTPALGPIEWDVESELVIAGESHVTGPIRWRLIDGHLPAGMIVAASGTDTVTLRGTPMMAGDFPFTIEMSDLGGSTARAYNLTVAVTQVFEVLNRSLASTHVDADYQSWISSRNASGAVTDWRVSAGSLPPGLSLAGDGPIGARIAGTPTSAGSYRFTITGTDGAGASAAATFSLYVSPRQRWIATVHSTTFGGPETLSLVNLSTNPPEVAALRSFSNADWAGVQDLTFAPGNDQLTFTHGNLSSKSLYLVDLAQSSPQPVLLHNQIRGDRSSPARFSPDGTKLAYARQLRAGSFSFDVRVRGPGGSASTVNTESADYSQVWSPDSSKLAFCDSDGRALNVVVWTHDIPVLRRAQTDERCAWVLAFTAGSDAVLFRSDDGLGMVGITRDGLTPSGVVVRGHYQVEVSEDAGVVLIWDWDSEGGVPYRFDTSSRRYQRPVPVTTDPHSTYNIRGLSPDSRWALLSRLVADAESLFLVELTAGPPRQVTDLGLSIPRQFPRWTPDSQHVVYTTSAGLFELGVFESRPPQLVAPVELRSGGYVFLAGSGRHIAFHARLADRSTGNLYSVDMSSSLHQPMPMAIDPVPGVETDTGFFQPDTRGNAILITELNSPDGNSLWYIDLNGTAPVAHRLLDYASGIASFKSSY